mmetsp:Transcript_28644/g.66973  ORF Transcript_28644/g.66973 Transcript_28644/m.66973 type:complete len:373 (-) Transcript_28644:178-1296(-)
MHHLPPGLGHGLVPLGRLDLCDGLLRLLPLVPLGAAEVLQLGLGLVGLLLHQPRVVLCHDRSALEVLRLGHLLPVQPALPRHLLLHLVQLVLRVVDPVVGGNRGVHRCLGLGALHEQLLLCCVQLPACPHRLAHRLAMLFGDDPRDLLLGDSLRLQHPLGECRKTRGVEISPALHLLFPRLLRPPLHLLDLPRRLRVLGPVVVCLGDVLGQASTEVRGVLFEPPDAPVHLNALVFDVLSLHLLFLLKLPDLVQVPVAEVVDVGGRGAGRAGEVLDLCLHLGVFGSQFLLLFTHLLNVLLLSSNLLVEPVEKMHPLRHRIFRCILHWRLKAPAPRMGHRLPRHRVDRCGSGILSRPSRPSQLCLGGEEHLCCR